MFSRIFSKAWKDIGNLVDGKIVIYTESQKTFDRCILHKIKFKNFQRP